MATINDYTNLITAEHSDKQKFYATVSLSCQPPVDLINFLSSVTSLYDIDTAIGTQLDVVGQWIGKARQLAIALTGVYFTLDTGPGLDSGILQGPFDPSTGLTALPDNYYRLLLKAKILNNQWDGSKPTAYYLSDLLFGPFGYNLFIQDNSDMSMVLGLIGAGTPPTIIAAMFTSGMLNLKPAAVKIAGYAYQAVTGPLFALDMNNTNFAGLDTGYLATYIFN